MKDQTVVISLGQGGGNIADEFAALSYNTLAINSAKEDLGTLKNVSETLHLLGGEGARRDMSIGEMIVLRNLDRIAKRIDTVVNNKIQLVVFAVALGGGTGAGGIEVLVSDTIARYRYKYHQEQEEYRNVLLNSEDIDLSDIQEPEIPERFFCAICIMPGDKELSRVHENATRSLEALASIDGLGGILCIDNSKAINGDYIGLNSIAVKYFDGLLNISNNTSSDSNAGIIDKNDLKKMLAHSMFMSIFPVKGAPDASTAKKVIEGINSSTCFCDLDIESMSYDFACGVLPDPNFDPSQVYSLIGKPVDALYTYSDTDTPFFAMFGSNLSPSRLQVSVDKVKEGFKIIEKNAMSKSKALFKEPIYDLDSAEKTLRDTRISKMADRQSMELKVPKYRKNTTPLETEVAATVDGTVPASTAPTTPKAPKTAADLIKERLKHK